MKSRRRGAHGITFSEARVDLAPAQERSRAIAEQLAKGVGHLFKKNKVTHIEGRGRLLGGGRVEVEAELTGHYPDRVYKIDIFERVPGRRRMRSMLWQLSAP